VIGYTKTVKSFTREKLLDFFRRYYVANNVTLVVVGDFDAKKAQARIADAFGKMSARPVGKSGNGVSARREPACEPAVSAAADRRASAWRAP